MKKWLPVVLVTGLMAVMAPMARGQDDGQGDGKVIFRIGTVNEIDSLNPFKAVEAPSYELFSLNYQLLVGFGQEDLGPVPDIAESWETSEDGLTWTYHLNPDATWSDGEPVTSEDVKYTYERVLEEEQALFIDYVRQIDTIETPDDHTLVITTKKPSVQMLSMWVPILPEHVWEGVPAKETKSFENEPTVGSGPFRAVEWRREQFVRLEANPNYFRGAPAVDEVIMQFYDNPDTMVQALKQGEVDYITGIPTRLFRTLEGQQGIETLSSASPGFTEVGMNVYEPTPEAIKDLGAPKESQGNPALLDVNVRQAINWAIDEEALTDRVLLGEGQVGSTIVPPTLAKYHLELEPDEVMGFDIDRAKELLADAGWEDANGDGIVEKDGEDLELELLVRSESSDTVKAGQFIKGWLEEAGIRITTKAVSDATLTEVIYAAEFDLFIWGWGSDPDPDFILSVLTCDQIMGWSDSFWCDDEYSSMYQEQKTQLDLDERAETIQEMQRIAYEESPYVVLFYDNALEAYRTDRFSGWTRQPAGTGSVLFAYGPYTYLNLEPASAEETAAGDEGMPAIVWVLIAVAVIVLLALGAFWMRRGSREERA
jgi:peptide/nickel transport system substrate-binding protein